MDKLKAENDSLSIKNTILDLDVTCLTDKLSTLMREIDDLKYTLARFVKGKNTIDAMLGTKMNF